VVRKSENGVAEYWLAPTRKISGIESPDLLRNDVTNYWNAAWEARKYLFTKLQRQIPRDAIGLAVNSCFARSQDQLHIHINCVTPHVRKEIKENIAQIGNTWVPLPFDISGHRYNAVRIEGSDLAKTNPFIVMARGLGIAEADMNAETLVAVGTKVGEGLDGFVLLEDHANRELGDSGWGEEVLDATCSVTKQLQ
jgi:CDP-diacylglycerol pyrophosphatase